MCIRDSIVSVRPFGVGAIIIALIAAVAVTRLSLIHIFCNVSDKPYTVEPFERVAQMVIAPVIVPTVTEVSELSDTEPVSYTHLESPSGL